MNRDEIMESLYRLDLEGLMDVMRGAARCAIHFVGEERHKGLLRGIASTADLIGRATRPTKHRF